MQVSIARLDEPLELMNLYTHGGHGIWQMINLLGLKLWANTID